jgi:hypothetical protein
MKEEEIPLPSSDTLLRRALKRPHKFLQIERISKEEVKNRKNLPT